MATSKIHWTDKVWNPITGCTPASEGCTHCYAKRMANRLRGRCGYPQDEPFRVTLHPDKLNEPLRWKKPCRVFVCSMGDLFHEDVPNAWIDQVIAQTQRCPQHTFILLTKRPERMAKYFHGLMNDPEKAMWYHFDLKNVYCHERHKEAMLLRQGGVLPNVWLGVTAENQARADERIPILLNTPAAVRFVSVEPMLGPVDLRGVCANHVCMIDSLDGMAGWPIPHEPSGSRLDWVICGCESGPSARPFDLRWARMLRDQCVATGTPFFFKQAPNPEQPGKTISMPELDGQVWAQYPKGQE